jgi:hypothetical protein
MPSFCATADSYEALSNFDNKIIDNKFQHLFSSVIFRRPVRFQHKPAYAALIISFLSSELESNDIFFGLPVSNSKYFQLPASPVM